LNPFEYRFVEGVQLQGRNVGANLTMTVFTTKSTKDTKKYKQQKQKIDQ